MKPLITFLALLLSCAGAHAQVQIDKRYAQGQPIVAKALDKVPQGSAVAYKWVDLSPGCVVLPVGNGQTAHLWASVGKHELLLVVAFDQGDKAPRLDFHRAEFVVTADPNPTPIDESLVDLVSPESAKVLAEFHEDWSKQLGKLSNRENFNLAYKSTREGLKLTDAAEAYAVIDSRLAAVEDFPAELAAELADIAQEFGGDPQPVPPEPDPEPETGPRVVLIVHETQDDTADFGRMAVQLRNGTEADWLNKQGHKLFIFDDDTLDLNGNKPEILAKYEAEVASVGLPALVIIDRKTEQAVKVLKLRPDATASNVTEYIRQTGG